MDAWTPVQDETLDMPRKTYSPSQVVKNLRRAEALMAAGASLNEAAKALGVTHGTLMEWREKFDVLATAGIQRIKQLEAENARLRRAIAELDEQLSEPVQSAATKPAKRKGKSTR